MVVPRVRPVGGVVAEVTAGDAGDGHGLGGVKLPPFGVNDGAAGGEEPLIVKAAAVTLLHWLRRPL